jgi:hypothetical protein
MIDWNAPLEAVHTDGRVVSVTRRCGEPDSDGDYVVSGIPAGYNTFNPSGRHYDGGPWTIRNVIEQPAWRTSDEQLDRMNALVERICDAAGRGVWISAQNEMNVVAEVKAVISARQPVDPRFDKVLSVLQQNERWLMPEDAARRFVRDVLAALDA